MIPRTLSQRVSCASNLNPPFIQLRQFLEGSPLLYDLPKLDLYRFARGSTVAIGLAQAMNNGNSKDEVESLLRSFPRTAGRDLLLVFTGKSRERALNAWCERYGDALLALAPERQASFAEAFLEMDLEGRDEWSPKTLKTMRSLRAQTGTQVLADLRHAIAMGAEPQETLNRAQSGLGEDVFTTLSTTEPQTAKALYRTIVRVEKALLASGKLQRPRFYDELGSSRLLEKALPVSSESLGRILFLLDLLNEEEQQSPDARSHFLIEPDLLRLMQREVSRALGDVFRAKDHLTAFQRDFANVSEQLDALPHRELLMPAFYQLFKFHSSSKLNDVIAWLAEQSTPLAKELEMAARAAEGIKSHGALPEVVAAFYTDYLADPSRLPDLQLAVGMAMASELGGALPWALMQRCASLLDEQWKLGAGPVHDYRPLIRRFLEEPSTRQGWKTTGEVLQNRYGQVIQYLTDRTKSPRAKQELDLLAEIKQVLAGR